jgi:beta-lactam-binding protein with PASTA domain
LPGPVATRQVVYEEAVPVEAPPRRPLIWPWLVLLLLLVVAGLAALFFFTRDDGDAGSTATTPAAASRVEVPDVVGIRADRAAAQLVDAGLKVEFRRTLSKKPSGIVLQEEPAAATSVPRGSTVVLDISRGADTVSVPPVVGLALNQALQKLQDAGLKGEAKRVASDKPAGQVIAQEPGGSGELKRGATVVLTVSKGTQPVAVPDVVGQTEADAAVALEQAGLKAGVLRVPASEPAGTVVAQSPAAGKKAPKGSRVQINVSKGTSTTGATSTTTTTTTGATTPAGSAAVPDVVDLKQKAAKKVLENAGFKADPKLVPSREPKGTVVAQFPAAGKTAKRGASIRINVSKGDGKVAVPDVVGEDEGAARQRLEKAGFTVTVLDQDTTDPAEDGTVLDETPAPGGRLKPGAEVTITVGRLTSG